jgi:hypothetical protein
MLHSYFHIKTRSHPTQFLVYFYSFSYSRSYILPDDGYIYIYIAETCICFYMYGNSCVLALTLLLFFVYASCINLNLKTSEFIFTSRRLQQPLYSHLIQKFKKIQIQKL